MKKSFKLVAGVALVAALSACGGGDDNDTSTGGGPIDTPPPPVAPLTVKQMQWLGYQSIDKAVALPSLSLMTAAFALSANSSEDPTCSAPTTGPTGTVKITFVDTDPKNTVSVGDTSTVVFSNCLPYPGASPISGTVQIAITNTDGVAEAMGNPGSGFQIGAQITVQKGFIYGGESLEGKFISALALNDNDTTDDFSDDSITFETHADSMAFSESVNGAVISSQINNFVGKGAIDSTNGKALQFNELSYDVKGDDSVLGSYAGTVSLVTPISIEEGVAPVPNGIELNGSTVSGAIKTDLGSESVTTTFAGNPVTVTFLSSKNTTSTLGINDFLKLLP